MARPILWTREDANGDEITTSFPAKYEICDRCRGEGTRDHPAFRNGITASEWAEWDDDDREHYMSGRYDVECDACEGGKVRVIDEDAIREGSELHQELADYYKYQENMYQYQRMCEWERRMGA